MRNKGHFIVLKRVGNSSVKQSFKIPAVKTNQIKRIKKKMNNPG